MTLVQRIRKLCKNKNISLFELEEKTGIKHGNIYRWDSSIPSVDKVGLVAKYLGTSVDYLIGNDEDGNTVDNIYTSDAAELLRMFYDLGTYEREDLIWYAKALKTKYSTKPVPAGRIPLKPRVQGYEPLDPYLEKLAKDLGVIHDDDEEK